MPAAPRSRQHAAATHRPQGLAADAELLAPTPPPASLRGRVSAERIDGAPSPASRPANADPAPSRQAARASATAPHDGAAPPHVPRRPMSAPALAERHAAAAEPRPVVHVTIDRIDVRAPAAPPRPATAPRVRNAAPSVSLADYLRQGGAHARGQAMSSPLAIGAVSAVLRNLLDNGMVEQVALGTTVNVTATAPDLIHLDAPDEPPQLNIFLYQVTPNAALRNHELPSRSARGERISNPPLALDLHYLVTATAEPTSRPRSCWATRCTCCTSGRCSTGRRSAARSTRARSTSRCCRRPSRRSPPPTLPTRWRRSASRRSS
jgi:hypothetical protein